MNSSSIDGKFLMGPTLPVTSVVTEVIVIALACLAPWAIGSVDAWAILLLDSGVALIGLLTTLSLWRSGWPRHLFGVPSFALLGLILLSILQASTLPLNALKAIVPYTSSMRDFLLPIEPEHVIGDDQFLVELSSPTISMIPDETVQTTSRLITCLVLFQSVLALKGGYGALRRFGLVTCANATCLALFAVIQALSWNGKIYWIRPSPVANPWYSGGPFVCRNHLAQYLNIGLGFALAGLILGWKRQRESSRGSGLWPAYATGVIFVGILISHSRGGLLATLVATIGVLIIFWLRFGKLPLGLILCFGTLAAFVTAILFAIGDSSPYQARLATMLDSSDLSLTTRFSLWKISLLVWWDHPIFGTGFGSFPTAVAPYFERDFGVYFHRAENEYVDLLVEGGLVGFFLGLTMLIAIIFNANRAWINCSLSSDWGGVLGACFGGLAVIFHSCFDFGLHIPGVGFTVVVLAAHLYRQGIQVTYGDLKSSGKIKQRTASIIFGIMTLFAMLWVVALQYRMFRCEEELSGSGVPLPGAKAPSADEGFFQVHELERDRLALEKALAYGSNWCDGYLWLGKIYVNLYQLAEERRIGGMGRSIGETSLEANPLSLMLQAQTNANPSILARAIRKGDPVRTHLVPALRCFLEARRCNSYSALAHAKIASLAFLNARGDAPSRYVDRAFALSGWDEEIVDFIAEVSARIGKPEMATRCWRKSLVLRPEVWPFVADCAASVLSPRQILNDLLFDGKHTVQFAERLYSSEADRELRTSFLQEALVRLPRDRDLSMAERIWLEGQARAGLDQRDWARRLMKQSLSIEPTNSERRFRFVNMLLAWGDAAEAHRQALAGAGLDPGDRDLQKALRKSVEAMSRIDRSRSYRDRN